MITKIQNLVKKFNHTAKMNYTIDSFFDFYGKPRSDILVDQKPSELIMLIDLLILTVPMNIVEIGQYDGGTMFYLLKYASLKAKIIGVDIDHSRFKLEKDNRLELITADSSDIKTFETVKSKMPEIELLFIDGYHYTPVVEKDYEYYASLVKNGFVAFHDINWGFGEPKPGVGQLWQKIKAENEDKYAEFIQNPQPSVGCYGIGILFKGNILDKL